MNIKAAVNPREDGPGLALAAVLLAAVLGGCSGNVSSRTDVNLNGHRRVTQVLNGTKRTLETRDAVVFAGGKIVKFPPGAVVQLDEKQDGRTKTAELRERDGKPELWIKENGVFRKATAEEHEWLEDFLRLLQIDDGGRQKLPSNRKNDFVHKLAPCALPECPGVGLPS